MIISTQLMKEDFFEFQLEMVNYQSHLVFESNLFYFNEAEGFFERIKTALVNFVDKIVNFFRNVFSKNVEKVEANVNSISTTKTNDSAPKEKEQAPTGETITAASTIWLYTILDQVEGFSKTEFNVFCNYLGFFERISQNRKNVENKIVPYCEKFKSSGVKIGILSSKTVEDAHSNFKEDLEGTNTVVLVKDGQLKTNTASKEKLVRDMNKQIDKFKKTKNSMENQLKKFKQTVKRLDNVQDQDMKKVFSEFSNIVVTSTNICIAYLTDSLVELNKTANAVKKVEKMFNI